MAYAIRTATPATLLLAAALAGCAGGSDSPPECTSPGGCSVPPGTSCRVATCVQGACGLAPAPAGTPAPDPTANDCQTRVCDAAGNAVAAPDDGDLPLGGTTCLAVGCSGGTPTQAPANARTPCEGGGLCDGLGACVACLAPEDCPAPALCATRTCAAGVCGTGSEPPGTPCGSGLTCDGAGHCAAACGSPADCPGSDGECRTRTCVASRCGVDDAAPGTVLAAQVAGDCRRRECDGAGGVAAAVDDADLPVDGDPCTLDRCDAGVPSNPPAPPGTPCASGGGTVCDGAGACVECASGATCPSGVCLGGACQPPSCTDLVKNGSETGTDCGGLGCPPCGANQGCLVPADCTSTYCFGGFCRADLNGCTAAGATDRTGDAAVTITFPVGLNLVYSIPCLRVRAGTTVTFTGDFLFHPLMGGYSGLPAAGGPFVPITNAGTTKAFLLDAPGEYPYYCAVHSTFGMAGAVFVVP